MKSICTVFVPANAAVEHAEPAATSLIHGRVASLTRLVTVNVKTVSTDMAIVSGVAETTVGATGAVMANVVTGVVVSGRYVPPSVTA